MIALDYRRDPSTTWEHVCDVHADDLRDHLSWWSGPSLTTGDLVRAVGDGHESLYVWLDSGLWDVRDERGRLRGSAGLRIRYHAPRSAGRCHTT